MSIVFDSASSATMTYSFTDENSEVQAGELQLYPYQFGCALPGTWNGSLCVFPMGDKIGNVQQLPAGCDTFRDACWKAAIAAGTVKFIATSAMMTGYSNRPVVFAYFRNTTAASGVTGLWNSLPVYADDASPAAYDIGGGFASQIDRVYGTPNGIILHDASSGLCAEWAWNATSLTWAINGTGISTPIPFSQ
jgi:hypothetical protein